MRLIFGLAVVLLFASVARAGDYEDALAKAQKEGKPLIVVITASWCQPCMEMKRNVIEPMKTAELKDAVVVVLDVDDPKCAEAVSKIRKPGDLPQIAIAVKVKDKWARLHAIGSRSRLGIVGLMDMLKRSRD